MHEYGCCNLSPADPCRYKWPDEKRVVGVAAKRRRRQRCFHYFRHIPFCHFKGFVLRQAEYQWAEEYFRDLDVKEDKTEEDEKFVPRPYRGISSTPKKKAKKKKPQPVKKEKPKEPEQLSMDNQITLDSFLQPEKMAG